MEVFAILAFGAVNIACFLLGAKVGQRVQKGEEIQLPRLDPVAAIREHRAEKEQDGQREKYAAILQNIESYDGTGKGQQEIPKR